MMKTKKRLGPPLSPTVQRRKALTNELQQMPTLDKTMTTELIKLWHPKFVQWAHQYVTSKFEAADIYQNCCLWLMEALQDDSYPGDFKVYHYLDYKLKRTYLNQAANVSMSRPKVRKAVDNIVDDQAVDSDYRLDMLILHTYLADDLNHLSERKERILRLNFDFNENIYQFEQNHPKSTEIPNRPLTMIATSEIWATKWDIPDSYTRVQQIRNWSFRRLRKDERLTNFNY